MSNKPNFCSNCGEKLDAYAEIDVCPKCHTTRGERPDYKDPKPSIVEHLPYKSPGTSALIAFIGGIFGLPGIGHMYVGKVGRGIGILILGLILYAILIIMGTVGIASLGISNSDSAGSAAAGVGLLMFVLGIVYIVFFIWQIFNARNLAKKFNEIVRTTGKEPW